MTDHPMDNFPVRPLRFDIEHLADEELVWSKTSPEFSMFINALGLHVPYFERFLVGAMRAYRDELDDASLKQDVRRIIGQEAHHAFNFVKFNRRMAQTYAGIDRLDREAQTYFQRALEGHDKRFHIGFTAGYETFTFLGGMIILDRFDELMADAQADMRAMWVWHQVEEVEHGAVAFDFYQAFFREHEWYRKWMVFYAFCHIAKETMLVFKAIVAHERPTLGGKLKAWKFFAGFAKDLFVASLPVYRRSYHPRRHPICNEEQNRVAVAWRKYAEDGGNPLQLDERAVNMMLNAAS